MDASGFASDTLAAMRLSQLRELARRIGVARYSNLLRDQLIVAIQARSPRLSGAEVPQAPFAPEPPHQAPVALPAPREMVVAESPTWVLLTPLDPQWALVRWGISGADRTEAHSAGGQQLALRLTDVTDNPSGDAHPHTLQEVVVETTATEWHLPVPLGDRDYRVALGYRTSTGGWIPLASSAVVRMPADREQPFPPLVAFSLAAPATEQVPSLPPPPVGLHERLYQQAGAARHWSRQGSEVFHEQQALSQAAAGGQLSGIGPWASGREASGAGMAARPRSFWLVADAELIVYGATDPSARLTVGDEILPLASDGTFRLHTVFPDGDQNYPIAALAADGEQKRSITLDFQRRTPHAKVNQRDEAVVEWF